MSRRQKPKVSGAASGAPRGREASFESALDLSIFGNFSVLSIFVLSDF